MNSINKSHFLSGFLKMVQHLGAVFARISPREKSSTKKKIDFNQLYSFCISDITELLH